MFSAGRQALATAGKALANAETKQFGGSALFNAQNTFKIQDPQDFNERVKNSKKPVIVDFFASWCNPCRTLTPRLESVINEADGKILLAKVDIDENTDLALDYEVMSVPVLLAIENGKVVDKMVGLQDTDKLRKFVNQVLKDGNTKKE